MSTVTLEAEPRVESTFVFNRNEHRCDRCGSEAFVRASKGANKELFFCGHHGHAHMSALIAAGFIVDDQRHRINAKPSVSANAD